MTTKKDVAVRGDNEADRLAAAFQALAELGGLLLGEDDITFGDKFVIPRHLNLGEAAKVLRDRHDKEAEVNRYERTYNYRPTDGAIATEKAMRQAFGFATGKTLWSFFGRNPPQAIDVEVGPNGEMQRAPWGAMAIPGLEDTVVYLQSAKSKDYGEVFHILVDTPRKYRFHIEGLFTLIQHFLETESIFRGKAIDGDGHFIDTTVVDPTKLVYTDSVARRLEGDLWSFIRYEHQLAAEGMSGKYAVLLEGPHGSGKTEAAGVTAQVANAYGWTFLMCRPGQDNLKAALQMARLYPPAIVFAEDIDTEVNAGRTDINVSLDMIDGFHTKGQKLIVVFTTNHADQIHKGMLRPGRIGAVIHIGEMERKGIEVLAKRVITNLDPDVDFDKVAVHMEGYLPAFVREAFNRAIRYSISANQGKVGLIGTNELCDAADGLRDQLDLMNGAKSEVRGDTLTQALTNAVQNTVESVITRTALYDSDGDWMYEAKVEGIAGNGR